MNRKSNGHGVHPPAALIFKNLRADWSRHDGSGRSNHGREGLRGRGRSGFGSGRCEGYTSGNVLRKSVTRTWTNMVERRIGREVLLRDVKMLKLVENC
jgi:hypothetical protein